MSKNVVIIATRYNAAANYTYGWAQKLRDDLVVSKGCASCLLVDGESLCRSGAGLAETLERAHYVVFYGHGEQDRWLALPAGRSSTTVAMIDPGTIYLLDGCQVYAACCHSLLGLGATFKGAFATADYIGYSTAFDFSIPNQEEFRKIIHLSVRDFVLGATPAATIVSDQRDAWDQLDRLFSTGVLRTFPEAPFAASCARSNALAVGMA